MDDAPAAPAAARFEALGLPHLDALFAFARTRTAADADAEDAVQEACVRAWRGFDGLREDGRARAWVFRILRRTLADQHRDGDDGAGASLASLEAAHEELVASPDPDPLEALLAKLSHGRVREVLGVIPQEFGLAVALCDVAGFRYREIAEILEVPIGTVMSRIHRGRKLLAGWVAEGGMDGVPTGREAELPVTATERVGR